MELNGWPALILDPLTIYVGAGIVMISASDAESVCPDACSIFLDLFREVDADIKDLEIDGRFRPLTL
ncbi:MAG: hypothetical protein EOO04_33540 [Chitinophagaceae bacterium]|nr:MAG: hypothetical protein EOO04_33540 [Chitinophagaceae bacterium]